jgi:hydroxymethylpyrimidine/phosphomethylpyrimidine kinase
VPDRLFWAQTEDDEAAEDDAPGADDAAPILKSPFELPPNGTKH